MKTPKFIAVPICWAVKRFNEFTRQYELFSEKGVCLSEEEANSIASFQNSLIEEEEAGNENN